MTARSTDPLMSQIIEKSIQSSKLIEFFMLPELKENQFLKHFTMWSIITVETEKRINLHHKIVSSWDVKNDDQSLACSRAILRGLVKRLGLPKIEEILTELRIGAPIDEEDNIN